jgi:hypothetical protein
MSKWRLLTLALSLALTASTAARAEPDAGDAYRVTGPAVHANLAIYFVHGQSRSGPVPLTLQEALGRKSIEIREVGHVNDVEIENTGNDEIFIQSGDIVKGGKQDRVLSVSLVLQPHSGPVSIASFCVEQGRWSARSGEDVAKFSSAASALPSRAAKIEMARSALPPARRPDADISQRQQQIWKSVAEIKEKLSSNLGAPVAAPQSQTSLQLALENGGLGREQADYVKALQPLGEQDDDIVGYVFAVNGTLNSADIYPSNGLFRKMWPKLLRASATEAIGERSAHADPAPPTAAATGFLDSAKSARSVEASTPGNGHVTVGESAKALFTETRPAAAAPSAWMHRNYLAH